MWSWEKLVGGDDWKFVLLTNGQHELGWNGGISSSLPHTSEGYERSLKLEDSKEKKKSVHHFLLLFSVLVPQAKLIEISNITNRYIEKEYECVHPTRGDRL